MKRRFGRVEQAAGSRIPWLRAFVIRVRRPLDSFWLPAFVAAIFAGSISVRPATTCLPSGSMANEVIVVSPSIFGCKVNYPDFTLKARALFTCPEADRYTFEQNPPAWPVAGGLSENSHLPFVITVRDGATLVKELGFFVTTIQPVIFTRLRSITKCADPTHARVSFLQIQTSAFAGAANPSCISSIGPIHFFDDDVEITSDRDFEIGLWPIRAEVRQQIGDENVLVAEGFFNILVNPPCSTGGFASTAKDSVCFDESTTITLGGHSGAVQRWESSTDDGNSWTSIAKTSTQIPTGPLSQTTQFRAVLSTGDRSTVATVTVVPPSLSGTATAVPDRVRPGSSSTIILSDFSGTVRRWQWSLDGIDWVELIGSEGLDRLWTGVLNETAFYRAVVQSGECPPVFSNEVAVTVDATAFSVSITPRDPKICAGQNLTLTANASGDNPPYTYLWNTPSGDTTQSIIVSPTTSKGYFVTVTDSASRSQIASVVVTVLAGSVGGSALANTPSVCSGSPATITLSGQRGTVQKWQSSLDGTFWEDVPSTAGLNSLNIAAVTQTTSFRAVVQSGACAPANSSVAAVTVVPGSVGGTASALTPVVCSGSPATITLGGQTGLVQKWQSSVDGMIWTDVPSSEGDNPLNIAAVTRTTSFLAVVRSGGCAPANSSAASVTVNESADLTAEATAEPIVCNGGKTRITVTANGGSGAYSYSLDGGSFQTSATFENIGPGNYTVTVRDVNGCTTTASVSVSEPGVLFAGGIAEPIVCNGGKTRITASANGGSGVYSYSLDGMNYQASGTFENIGAGNYAVTVKDINGCTSTAPVSVSQPAAFNTEVTAETIACHGGTTSIMVSVNGDTGPYTYSLDGVNFQTSTTFEGVGTGNYRVLVRDVHGCVINAAAVSVGQPVAALNAGATAGTIACNGGTASITASATGGSEPYGYSLNGVNFQSSQTFEGMMPGTYLVTVKDIRGCTSTVFVTVNQPAVLDASATVGMIPCNGGAGSITASANGGSAPYNYSLDGVNFQTAGTFENIGPGNYTVKVKDVNECTSTALVSVSEPTTLIAGATAEPIICNRGKTSITAGANGGTGPYSYSLDGVNFQNAGTFENVGPGDYTVTVKDAKGCSATSSSLVLKVNDTVRPVITTCPQPRTLSAEANCQAVLPDFLGELQASDNCTTATQLLKTQNPASGTLISGPTLVTFMIRDEAGNEETCGITIRISDTVKPNITSCPADQSTSAGADCKAAVPDLRGNVVAIDHCTPRDLLVISQSPAPGTMLDSGPHPITLSVTDEAGNVSTPCLVLLTVTDTTSPTVTLVGANPLVVECNTTFVEPGARATDTCAGDLSGSIRLGGSVDIQTPGVYSLSYNVTDPAGNAATEVVRLVQVLSGLPVITSQPISLVRCLEATATFSVTATGLNLSYQWQKGNEAIPGRTIASYTITSLKQTDAASYSVIVTGPCGSVTSTVATVTLQSPVLITREPQSQDVCTGANSVLSVAATGAEPLSYQWRKDGQDISGANQSTLALNNVSKADEGSYAVVVSGLCGSPQTSAAAALKVNNPVVIVTQPLDQNACVGGSTSFSVGAPGLGLGYQWRKDGQDISGATQPTLALNNVSKADEGSYAVVVSGLCGFPQTSAAAALKVNDGVPIATPPLDQNTCAGANVVLSVTATGPEPLSYQWRKGNEAIAGATSAEYTMTSLKQTDAGSYSVVVSGLCGSVTSAVATVTLQSPVLITRQPKSQDVCIGANAVLSVAATGTEPLSYQWRKGDVAIARATASSYIFEAEKQADAGNFSVMVSGPCGSVTSVVATVTLQRPVAITRQPLSQDVCIGEEVVLSVAASGTPPLSYQWRKGDAAIAGATTSSYTIKAAQQADAGSYSVVASGPCGSVTSAVATVSVRNPVVITSPPESQIVCSGVNAILRVTASGTGPLTYQWRKDDAAVPGATSSSYTINAAKQADGGAYSVLVTGPCGTVSSASATLAIKDSVPKITCPPAMTRAADAGRCGAVIGDLDLGAATASDGCSQVTITRTGLPAGNFFPVGETVITYTALNGDGNSSTCEQTVTVEDRTPPVARCKNLTLEIDIGAEVTVTPSQIDAGSSDNCGIANMSLSKSVFAIADLGTNPVTFTVTDMSGKSATCTATVTVQRKVLPSLSVDDITIAEGNSGLGSATFNVTLSSPAAGPITVDYATGDGTAQSSSDYELASGTMTFALGEVSKTIAIKIIGDSANEPDEVFSLNLSNPTGGTIMRGQAQCTIRNDDPRPQLSVGDVSVDEANSGTTRAEVTVNLSSASGQTVTVDYATGDSTAKVGSDYKTVAGQLSFARGETSKNISFEILGDILYELDETFRIVLNNPSQAELNRAQSTVTIRNDDPIPSLSISDATIGEGDSGSTEIRFTVSLSGPSSQLVSARFNTKDGTATAPTDYSSVTGEVTFPPTELTVSTAGKQEVRTVPVLQISRNSNGLVLSWASTDNTYQVQSMELLGSPGVWETVNAPVVVANGQSSVTLEPSASLRFYRLALRNGATPSLSKSVTVTVAGDPVFETDETFRIVLSAPLNAVLGRSEAEARILNDDPLPALSLADGSVTEGGGTAIMTVRLSQSSALPATVKWATADDTANSNTDYTAGSGTLTFPPGTVSQTLTVPIKDDSVDEADENFKIALSEPTNAQFAMKEAVVRIVDNDDLPRLSIRDVSALEGGVATLTVGLSAPSSRRVTVQYGTSDGTAKVGVDYTANSGTLIFEPGQTDKLIIVSALNDSVPETAEEFFVNLSVPTNAEIASGRATVTITDFAGGNRPPEIRLTSPEAEDQFAAGATIMIGAVASDTDGRVTGVEFFANGRLIGASTAPPFLMEWPDVEAGTYLLKAVATDNDGAFKESATVRVIVLHDRFTLRVAVVEGAVGAENLEVRKFLNDLDLISEFFTRDGITFEALRSFDIVIWDDVDAPANALAENHIEILQELRTTGRPIYFIGTNLLQSADHLPPASRTAWSELTRLRRTAAQTDGVAVVVIPDHRITDGPFGKAERFKLLGTSETVTRLGELEEALVKSGTVDLVMAYEDFDTLARTVSQNIPVDAGTNVNAMAQSEKLFKNAVWWLLDAAHPLTTYSLRLEVETEPQEPRVGENVTYTVTIQHSGEIEARGLSLVLTIPENMTFVSALSESGPCELEEGNVTCHLGTLTSGSQASVQLLLKANAAGPATMILSASSTLRISDTHTLEVSP